MHQKEVYFFMITLDKIYHAKHVLKPIIRETDLIFAPNISDKCKVFLNTNCAQMDKIRENAIREKQNLSITMKCDFDSEEERWHAPDAARHYPEEMVSSKIKAPDVVWK